MAEIVNLNEQRPHVYHEVICVKCCSRWVAVAPVDTKLIDYDCEKCGPGYVVLTGQPIGDKFQ